MTIVTFSKKQFEKDIGIFDEKMKDRIFMFGTPIEREEKDGISIEVFPNRPDLLSYHGFKRSFLAFLGKKTGLVNYKVNPPEKKGCDRNLSSGKDRTADDFQGNGALQDKIHSIRDG